MHLEGLTGGQMTRISLPQWIERSAGTQVPFFEIDSPKADSFRFRLQILTHVCGEIWPIWPENLPCESSRASSRSWMPLWRRLQKAFQWLEALDQGTPGHPFRALRGTRPTLPWPAMAFCACGWQWTAPWKTRINEVPKAQAHDEIGTGFTQTSWLGLKTTSRSPLIK